MGSTLSASSSCASEETSRQTLVGSALSAGLEWASLTDESASSDYSQKSLLELHRKSLQGQLGNLLSRISAPKILARLIEKDGASQSVTFRMPEDHVSSEALGSLLSGLPIQVDNYMQKFEVSKALEAIFEAIAAVSDLT